MKGVVGSSDDDDNSGATGPASLKDAPDPVAAHAMSSR